MGFGYVWNAVPGGVSVNSGEVWSTEMTGQTDEADDYGLFDHLDLKNLQMV